MDYPNDIRPPSDFKAGFIFASVLFTAGIVVYAVVKWWPVIWE